VRQQSAATTLLSEAAELRGGRIDHTRGTQTQKPVAHTAASLAGCVPFDRTMRTGTDTLEALAQKIDTGMGEKGRYMVTLPAELAQLRAVGEEGAHEFARRHGWSVVFHLGGEQIEFFKAVPGQSI
jgi:hypothetical protein